MKELETIFHQKKNIFFKDFYRKCKQVHRFLPICSYLLEVHSQVQGDFWQMTETAFHITSKSSFALEIFKFLP